MAGHGVGFPGTPAGAAAGAGPRPTVPVTRRRWLPLLFAGVVTAEVLSFLFVGEAIGFPLTVLLVLFASLLGLVLLRREGNRAWRGFQQALAGGEPPGPRASDGMIGLIGAGLLAAPGLLTGASGILLLLPPGRQLARRQLQARAERAMTSAQAGQMFGPRFVYVHQEPPTSGGDAADSEVVEGEIVDDSRHRPADGPG